MTFSEQIVYGWFKPSKYKDMIELPRRRFVVYVIVMMLVLAIVSYVVPTASIIFGFGGFEKLFTQSLGEVNYTDDTLSVSNNFDMHIILIMVIFQVTNLLHLFLLFHHSQKIDPYPLLLNI